MRQRGVKIEELRIGDGLEATRGSRVRIRYESFLNHGERLNSEAGVTFSLAHRGMIAGLRYGIEGMRPGGKRRIRVAPHLAYRDTGWGTVIPPNAVLIFEVELLEVIPDECLRTLGDACSVQSHSRE